MTDAGAEPAISRFDGGTDPFELRDELGDTWGEKVLVMLYEDDSGEQYEAEYYGAHPEKSHIRHAWPDYYDDPVWLHVNEVGYCLQHPKPEKVEWEIRDWGDCPVSTDWEVIYPA